MSQPRLQKDLKKIGIVHARRQTGLPTLRFRFAESSVSRLPDRVSRDRQRTLAGGGPPGRSFTVAQPLAHGPGATGVAI